MKKMLSALIFAGAVCALSAQDKLVREITFDEWEWVPLTQGLAKQVMKFKENGPDMPIEINGPSYRTFTKCHGLPGIMVEQGVKGAATRILAGQNNFSMFENAPLGGFIDGTKEYRYEFYLKGKGKFVFNVWQTGVNSAGEKKFLGVRPLITVQAPGDEWQKIEGTFRLPPNTPDKEYNLWDNKMLGGLIVNPGSDFCIDELRIYEKVETK